MEDDKISELTALTTPATGDLIPIVDISDTTDAATGTTKKITYTNLKPDATSSLQGSVEIATQAEVDAGTATGGTGASLVATPATTRGKLINDYAVDSVGTDAYAITITPAITAYAAGQRFTFKAGTANTGACTLNVSGLGAKDIKKNVSEALVTGDILANQIVEVVYDGTNMQMLGISSDDTSIQTFTSSGTWTKPGRGTLAFIQVWGGGGSGAKDSVRECGGGGGGGYSQAFIPLSSLASTETVTIGAGGALKSSNGLGNVGGDTTFGTWLTGYGGGAGGYDASNPAGGGGGGGSNAAGSAGSNSTGGAGGGLLGGAANTDSTFGGGGGGSSNNGGNSIYGGGGGARGGGTGGSSLYGGGGGGDTGGTSKFGGNGGSISAGTGSAGAQPGGGGARGTSGNSGAGGDGKCVVTVY